MDGVRYFQMNTSASRTRSYVAVLMKSVLDNVSVRLNRDGNSSDTVSDPSSSDITMLMESMLDNVTAQLNNASNYSDTHSFVSAASADSHNTAIIATDDTIIGTLGIPDDFSVWNECISDKSNSSEGRVVTVKSSITLDENDQSEGTEIEEIQPRSGSTESIASGFQGFDHP